MSVDPLIGQPNFSSALYKVTEAILAELNNLPHRLAATQQSDLLLSLYLQTSAPSCVVAQDREMSRP